jgi:hypothetical protein
LATLHIPVQNMRLWAGTGWVSAFSSKPYTRMTLGQIVA